MNRRGTLFIIQCMVLSCCCISCSTTRHLAEEEVLYTGIHKLDILPKGELSDNGKLAVEEMTAALAYLPNAALLGSSSKRHPFPVGLWIYSAFKPYKKGLGKWIFQKMASDPVYISTVNPALRCKIATNLLHDYGYFRGEVTARIEPAKKNNKKAKITYSIDMQQPFSIDTVHYINYPAYAMELIRSTWKERAIKEGEPFNVLQLEKERERLSTLFRNHGYYYYRPDYITFKGDTLQHPGHIALQVIREKNIPNKANRPWRIGKTSIYLTKSGATTSLFKDTKKSKKLTLYFNANKKGKPAVKLHVLNNCLSFKEGDYYTLQEQLASQEAINKLRVFRYSTFTYTPRKKATIDDTLDKPSTNAANGFSAISDTLDLRINLLMDKPLEAELSFNVTSKSNNQLGPGASFKLTKNNLFHGGERLSIQLDGSYEWQTNSSIEGSSSVINSYQMGVSTTLDYPRFVFPFIPRNPFHFPTTSTFTFQASRLNRAQLFNLISIGTSVGYSFQPKPNTKHTFTPIHLTYDFYPNKTEQFTTIMEANPALFLSFRNQFIPAMSYKVTYDNDEKEREKNHVWGEIALTSAGNITSLAYQLAGKSFNEKNKDLLGNPFAQFLKLTAEIRGYLVFPKKHQLVGRIRVGGIYAYGNSTIAPYSEQFFVGGANSIRAFTVRTIGPGSYVPTDPTYKYNYLNQTGDLKLDANIEYRFPLVGNLNGALFLDAGNVWTIRENTLQPGGTFKWSQLPKALALGTGAGLRYDLSFLVIRLDVGIALHAPYETGKKGYYNIPSFKDGMAYHLAIGYPF
ncbi:MAG: BamA/TamA family outer membrane protein [Bacteroidaceae bacterium]